MAPFYLWATVYVYVSMQTGDTPVCDPRKTYECTQVSKATFVRDNEAVKCNCPRQCHRLIYETTISQSKLAISSASFMKRLLNIRATAYDIANDYCIVEVCESIINTSLSILSQSVLINGGFHTPLLFLLFQILFRSTFKFAISSLNGYVYVTLIYQVKLSDALT